MAEPDPSSVRFDGPWRHLDVRANGIKLHAVEMGATTASAPLVLFLHGFAQFWWSWRHQLVALAQDNYRVVAVDLRGYGDSDTPPQGYDGWTLAGDTAGLIRALGHTSATLVGHADGGLVCWATAVLHPRLVSRIALISSPHPIALKQSVIRNRFQRKALLPTFLRYQLPFQPEQKLIRDGGREAELLIRARSGTTWTHSSEFPEVAQRVRLAIQIPKVAHSALEYQRWAFRSQLRSEGYRFMSAMDRPLTIPVLHLHGNLDSYVLADSVHRSATWAPDSRFVTVPGVGHYAQEESPDFVNQEIHKFLSS
ncbi:MAG: alpha/beta fold hydrolase [Mycobacteriaceae bacterium]